MTGFRRSRFFFLSFLILPFVLGCQTKADPAPNAGFINGALLSSSTDIPFQKAWRKKGVDLRNYREIFIQPVNTEYLLKMSLWEETGRGQKIREDIGDLAMYARDVLEKAFREDPAQRFLVVDAPSTKTLVLEFALVELVPSKAALNAAGLIPPIAIPASILGLTARSTVAFEARVRDGYSGEVLALFADREAAKVSIFNVKNYSWYSHAKSIIEEWSVQFVQVLGKKPNQVIKGSGWFELKPW